MSWFLIALFPPLLWGISNFIDKYLLSKYFKIGGIGALLIFSALTGTFLLPIIFIFQRSSLTISFFEGSLMILNGIIYMVALVPYLYALKKDETSVIVPIFQLIPVISYFLAYYILGETLTGVQIVASLLIIGGAIIIAMDIDGRMPRFKTDTFLLMFLSSLFYSFSTVIFKFVANNNHFWKTTFWEYIGFTLAAMILLLIPSYRKEFRQVICENKLSFMTLNIFNEIINILSRILMTFATLLAPLALVWVVNGFQSFFVFIMGIGLTIFFPHINSESLRKRHLLQKTIAIMIMFIGAYYLNK